jgi:hypothetical protein
VPGIVKPVIPPATKPPVKDGLKHCWDFKWQQDAQAAYLANLSDPAGLDSAVGPYNGDGLACLDLPVDPARPASTPVGAYVPPAASAPTKAQLVAPAKKYYGLTMDGVPFTTKPLDIVNAEVGKTPSLIQWFTNWNQTPTAIAAGYSGAFRADAVKTSWARGALPVITWQSMDSGFQPTPGMSRTDQPAYSLATILDGTYDAYIRQFAIDIVKTNLPVAIRFDQEMNGDFYPWNQRTALNGNSTGTDFAKMWRHVWSIFDQVGANANTIWIWAPNRVDLLGFGEDQQKVFNRYYPGDQFVDWLAVDAYWRRPNRPTDYNATFGKTVNLIKQVAPNGADGLPVPGTANTKPIFFAEVGALGASHDNPPVDLTTEKVAWINNMINGVMADPQVIGFAYFDNVAKQVQDDVVVINDWRIDANAAVLNAFKTAVNDPGFSGGLALDGSGAKE